jgi:hypothetical protein
MSLSRCPNAPATATFICSAPLFYIFPEEAYLLRYYLVLIFYRLYHSSALSTTEVAVKLAGKERKEPAKEVLQA